MTAPRPHCQHPTAAGCSLPRRMPVSRTPCTRWPQQPLSCSADSWTASTVSRGSHDKLGPRCEVQPLCYCPAAGAAAVMPGPSLLFPAVLTSPHHPATNTGEHVWIVMSCFGTMNGSAFPRSHSCFEPCRQVGRQRAGNVCCRRCRQEGFHVTPVYSLSSTRTPCDAMEAPSPCNPYGTHWVQEKAHTCKQRICGRTPTPHTLGAGTPQTTANTNS